jgi:alpha-2-macroglobulin
MLWLRFFLIINFLASPAYAAFDSAKANQNKSLELLRITPDGRDVDAGKEIVFQFNRPVVPLGKMERSESEIPITISPKPTCEWRWLDRTTLACHLNDKTKLTPATRYRILVSNTIKTEDGTALSQPVQHSFITERPKVSYATFKEWKAPSMPYVRLSFNQPVNKSSVEKTIFFESEKQRFNPVVEAPQTAQKKKTLDSDEEMDDNEEIETTQPEIKNQPDFNRVWIVHPEKMLPENAEVTLQIIPGLKSQLGEEYGNEQRVIESFATFPKFEFLGFSCVDNQDKEIKFKPNQKPDKRCNPLRTPQLVFSAPVSIDSIKTNLKLTPDLAGGRTDYDPWAKVHRSKNTNLSHRKNETYTVYLPELLKAYHNYSLELKSQAADAFGRTLNKPVSLQFFTDNRLPTYHFEHQTAVLESGLDSQIPIFTTNFEKLDFTYNLLTPQGFQQGLKAEQTLPKVKNLSVKTPMDVRRLISSFSGVINGTFYPSPNMRKNPFDNWFFGQITPFHVEVKAGHHNTLVWVTDLKTGQPVPQVEITAYIGDYGEFGANTDIRAKATTDENGIAQLPGTTTLDPDLVLQDHYDRTQSRLFVRAQKGDGLALIALDNFFAVQDLSSNFSVYSSQRKKYGHIHTWGTTAQGVYKVGDTIQYKLFVRDQSNTGFVLPPKEGYILEVKDPTGKSIFKLDDLKFSEFGTFSGEINLAKTAAVGWYDFELKANFDKNAFWSPLKVLVSDFTPAPFKVQSVVHGELFQAGDTVKVNTNATLHAGGAFVDAHAEINAKLSEETFEPTEPTAQGFLFNTYDREASETQKAIHQSEGTLNDKGDWLAEFKLPSEPRILFGKLNIENKVRDDRGKDIAARSSVRFVARDRFVGVKTDDFVWYSGKNADILLIVLNEQGKIAPNTPVEIKIQREETKAARVKGAGNAYLTEYHTDWVDETTLQAISGTERVKASFIPAKTGRYKATATVTDTKGRKQSSILDQWVSGKDEMVIQNQQNNLLEITSEKPTYHVGDTARYLVKNPFPNAKALITIERFGVIKSWVTTFEKNIETVEFKVEPDYLPGYFLSVIVVSPRIDKPIDENQVDLGKPSFRIGYAKAEIKDPYKELVVNIKSSKETYKPREEVTLDIQVSPYSKEEKTPQVELAVAVLDESVFDLISSGRDYFDPYKGFYTLDDLDVKNYNLLLKLVGRQKFEKKGANPGGDGARAKADMRSLFKFVSYWNPSLLTDKDGKAWAKFPIPDNLTGWKVLVMAVSHEDRMGLGESKFAVNLPLETRPILPNQVTVGDQFQAGFSVMNRTQQLNDITINITAKQGAQPPQTISQKVKAEPYKRQMVWLPLQAKSAEPFDFKVIADNGEYKDGLEAKLTVNLRRSLETAATFGTTTQKEVTENISIPADIYTDAGSFKLTTAPSLISNIDGAFEYMSKYPYVCWEQRLTKGVMASHFNNLRDWLSVQWDSSQTLPQQTLDNATQFQAPNGGMAFFVAEDQRVDAYLSAYTALAFNWLRDSKLIIPHDVENKLHEYLLNILRKNVMPDFYSKGMASTVRAVALAALSKHGKITAADIQRYQPHIPEMSLFGKAQFLEAALNVEKTNPARETAAKAILGQSSETGGKISFNEHLDDSFTRILATPLRDNCAILSALVHLEEQGNKMATGLPIKLARQIVESRKSRTHWENTQENMFCMNALIDYVRVYENTSPAMQIRSWLDTEKLGETSFKSVKDKPVSIEKALQPTDVGRKAMLKIEKEGDGRIYYRAQLSYAPKIEKSEAINAGIEVVREYSIQRKGEWILLQNPLELKTGDRVRVDLFVTIPTARNFVVVNDPIAGGFEPVNTQLATASQTDAEEAISHFAGGSLWLTNKDWHEYGIELWSFYHKELRHDSAQFYSDYLAAGKYHLSYMVQVVAPGEFYIPPTHVEEMYNPEVFGKSIPALLKTSRN